MLIYKYKYRNERIIGGVIKRRREYFMKRSWYKKVLSLLVTVCLLVGFIPVSAFATEQNIVTYSVTDGNIYFDKNTGMIIDCDKSISEAVIPEKIAEVSVISIGESAFLECNNLRRIIIPKSVSFIGGAAFADCKNLKSIKIMRRRSK